MASSEGCIQTNPFHFYNNGFVFISQKLDIRKLKTDSFQKSILDRYKWNPSSKEAIIKYILFLGKKHGFKMNRGDAIELLGSFLTNNLFIKDDPYLFLGDFNKIDFPEKFIYPGMAEYLRGAMALRLQFSFHSKYNKLTFWKKKGTQRLVLDQNWVPGESRDAVDFVFNKEKTLAFLRENGLPTPESYVFNLNDPEKAWKLIQNSTCEWVFKPCFGSSGMAVTVGIRTREELIAALEAMKKAPREHVGTKKFLLEKKIKGNDYRVWILNSKFIGAQWRMPPYVKGDGKSTLEDLLQEENHRRSLTQLWFPIPKNTNVSICLARQGLTWGSIPKHGQIVRMSNVCNFHSGATTIDLSDKVHPELQRLFEKATKLIGLKFCGLDVIAKDISVPIEQAIPYIIELNAFPGISPWKAGSRVAIPLLKELFSELGEVI